VTEPQNPAPSPEQTPEQTPQQVAVSEVDPRADNETTTDTADEANRGDAADPGTPPQAD
jgi:hypothetical protein